MRRVLFTSACVLSLLLWADAVAMWAAGIAGAEVVGQIGLRGAPYDVQCSATGLTVHQLTVPDWSGPMPSADVEQYVRRYGDRGWLAGLVDNRPLEHAFAPPSLRDSKRASQQRMTARPADSSPPTRVSDLFLWYYLRQYHDVPAPNRFDHQGQRDIAIASALCQTRARLNERAQP